MKLLLAQSDTGQLELGTDQLFNDTTTYWLSIAKKNTWQSSEIIKNEGDEEYAVFQYNSNSPTIIKIPAQLFTLDDGQQLTIDEKTYITYNEVSNERSGNPTCDTLPIEYDKQGNLTKCYKVCAVTPKSKGGIFKNIQYIDYSQQKEYRSGSTTIETIILSNEDIKKLGAAEYCIIEGVIFNYLAGSGISYLQYQVKIDYHYNIGVDTKTDIIIQTLTSDLSRVTKPKVGTRYWLDVKFCVPFFRFMEQCDYIEIRVNCFIKKDTLADRQPSFTEFVIKTFYTEKIKEFNYKILDVYHPPYGFFKLE